MAKRNQHYRSDFLLSHSFERDGIAVAVPQHMEIHYYTPDCKTPFIVSRKGEYFKNCVVSTDGMTLTSSIALSTKFIGSGALLYTIVEYIEDSSFQNGERVEKTPGEANVFLWYGPSDDGLSEVEQSTLDTTINNLSSILSRLERLTPINLDNEETHENMAKEGLCIEGQIYYTEEEA